MGDGPWILRGNRARGRAGGHRPGAVIVLRSDQKSHAMPDLESVPAAQKSEHVDRLSGGIGVAGKVPELAPAAIFALAAQEALDLFLKLSAASLFARLHQ